MANSVCLLEDSAFQCPHRDTPNELINSKRKQLQHEFKIFAVKYFKDLLGKSADHLTVTISSDLLIFRSEGFLTQPEKYIAMTLKGNTFVKASRMLIAKQFALENTVYFEERLGAKCIHQTFDIDAAQDFWIYVMVFDQLLIEQ